MKIPIIGGSAEENDEAEWMRWIAEEWKEDLGDPKQDIYTIDDGVANPGNFP